MKNLLLIACFFAGSTASLHAQGLKGLIKNLKTDSARSVVADKLFGGKPTALSADEIVNGLKEALQTGATKSSQKLSVTGGYFANAAIKILMPAEAKKVESTLRNFGMGKQVDEMILTMNRAAENAAKEAAPVFINAVKQMSIKDGWSILKGTDTAATQYLRTATTSPLTEAFRPVVESALAKLDASKHWNKVFSAYNQFSREKVNTDLTAYVTEKALAGIFYQVAQEEKDIRKNPEARTTELLRKVFAE